MGGGTLLRRRLGAHPVAVTAIAVSVLAALVVVTALQLLSAAITDAGVRSALDVPPGSRSLVATGTLRPGDLGAVDAGVRAALSGLPATRVTRVGTTTTRGLPGRAATDRAFLADVDGIDAAAELVDGRWPSRPDDSAADGDGTVEVALPEAAAEALAVGTGDTVEASDLVDVDGPVLSLEVVGTFRPRSAEDPLWVDLPLGLTGVTATEFTTYGPFVLAPGTLDGPLVGASTVTWRATPDLTALAADDLGPAEAAVDTATTDLRRLLGLPLGDGVRETAEPGTVDVGSPRVVTALPGLLRSAGLVGDRIRVSLLTPVVLLGLLGAVALVGSSALLASLRVGETRLLRTRGASTARLALLALGDATIVTVVAVAGTAVLAPVATRLVAGSAGPLWSLEDLGDADLWRAVLPLAVLAVAVTVATTLWVGRPGGDRGAARARAGTRVAAGSGLDLVLVGLGVLGAVQLRRYDSTGSTVVDPVTTVAPALVVGGLAVLCLRLLPVLARWVSGLGSRRPGLDLAWGGWQFARRAANQSGTLLLVLLAAAMGTIALGHSATVGQAVRDQSAFETGAPLRVARGISGGTSGTTGALVDDAAGGAAAVMPVWRGEVDLGGVSGVTVLGVDAAAADRVMAPRADTLAGRSWSDLTAALVQARDLGGGVELPGTADELTLRVRAVTGLALGRFGFLTSVQVRDGRGFLRSFPAAELRGDAETLTVRLGGRGLVPPVSLVGVAAPLPDVLTPGAPGAGLALDVADVAVDGAPLDIPEAAVVDSSSPSSGLWWAVPPSSRTAAPAVVTREVARALDVGPGGTASLPLGPRDLPITVAGVVDTLPTASTPTRGILLDLPTAEAVPDTTGSPDAVRSRAVFDPQEWWSAPADPDGAATRIRAEAAYGTQVTVRDEVVAERLADPVNAGMRAAMLLVTLASVVLAGVGFAASTAALGRQRRHENAVLLALGTPPGRIRRVLLVERALVVAVTVAVGLLLGLVSALTVVPLLVGGDGHPQVPPVQVDLPARTLAGYIVLLVVALFVVGALVLRTSGRDLAGELREGDGS